MNNNIKNIFRTGVMIATGVVVLASCSDTWKDHYDDGLGASGIAYQGSTMSYIQSKQELSDFAQVLQLTGFDARLSGDQKLTVWAPVNGSFNMDSLRKEIASNKDNVLKTFVQNHVALYALPIGDVEHRTRMLNTKRYDLPSFTDSINGTKMLEKNISCSNGITHIVEKPIVYRNNLYEQIAEEYNAWIKDGNDPSSCPMNLYAFLESKDTMIVDESRSISNGFDEYGKRVYVDAYYERDNEALGKVIDRGLVNADASIYEEDSMFIAIIPSPQAYQARYDFAKTLLKFHPKDSRTRNIDSLANEYANRFATYDLFYNNTNNKSIEDSLKSTLYSRCDIWENHVYYRHMPPHELSEYQTVNDIFAVDKYTKKVKCSNGEAYIVDEYPMSVTEQFYFPLRFLYANSYDAERSSAFSSVDQAYYYVPTDMKVVLRDSVKTVAGKDTIVQYLDTITPGDPAKTTRIRGTHVSANGSSSPRLSFEIKGTLSGRYNIKMVTIPLWARDKYEGKTPLDKVSTGSYTSSKAEYFFEAYIFEQDENGDYVKYPTTDMQLLPDSVSSYHSGRSFLSHTFRVDEQTGDSVVCMLDTITLGEYDFKYSYYGLNDAGVLLQIYCNALKLEDNGKNYTKDIVIHKFIFEPIVAEDKKSKGGK